MDLVVLTQMQQVAPQTLYEWWAAMPNWEEKTQAAIWLFSPGVITVLGSIAINASIRRIYEFSDKVMLPVAFIVSGSLGAICTLSLMDMINRSVGYQVYDTWAPVWAIPLSMVAVHVSFRLTCRTLWALYLIGGKLPESSKWKWLPIQPIAKQIYYGLTGKSIYHPPAENGQGDITRMMDNEDTTDRR